MATTIAGGRTRVFSSVFDPRANGLNFVRLLLAISVIVWHAFPLSGNDIAWHPLRQAVGEIGVDGFFAISGYLIVASWVRDPHLWRYLRARALRILPAFWVCLILTAVVFAPIFSAVLGVENLTYVVYNAGLFIVQEGIDGSPMEVPFPGAWNGSLWTLWWEFSCYIGVMLLGLVGLLRRRGVLATLFLVALAMAVATSSGIIENWYVVQASRFGLMFLAGATIWQYRERIPVTASTVGLAIALIVGSLFLPNYRLVAALPLAYSVLVLGALIKEPRLRLRNDVSYGVYIYAFPIQQILAIVGATALGVPLFAGIAIALTVPLAAASWFLVEKPMMRLKGKRPELPPSQSVAAF